MPSVVVTAKNPFHPVLDRTVCEIDKGLSVAELAPTTQRPFICIYNGAPLLREDWESSLSTADGVIMFVYLPAGGGGGSDPMRIVLSVAVMAAAIYLGPAVGQFGLNAFFGNASIMPVWAGQVATAMGTAFVATGGAMLMNAVHPPKLPSSEPTRAADMAAPSPTYSVSAQGNSARLGQPIPVQYGYLKRWPDFAAAPYTEYQGNDQWLYQLLMLGQGEYDIEEFGFENTAFAKNTGSGLASTGVYEDISWEVIEPGQSVSLFPTQVSSAVEVSGQLLEHNSFVGPFPVNAAGTEVNRVGFDIICPRGLYYANDRGEFDSRTVKVRFYIRKIDDLGQPLGLWVDLGQRAIKAATNTPQRRSYSFGVAKGRYEARVIRTNELDTSHRAGHDVAWEALRGYHPSSEQYGNKTLLAFKLKASGQLSSQVSRRLYVKATRKLLTWNPSSGWSSTPVATRSIAWAALDACKAEYGMELADTRVNLLQMYQLHLIWESRSDRFDGCFDVLYSWWEALQQIVKAGRAKAYTQTGVVNFVRDQETSLPVALFCHRNILPNSMSIDYAMPDSDTADGVTMHYFDETVWKTVPLTVPAGATKPGEDKILGVTNRSHAAREAYYQWASTLYRRKFVTLQTEFEGFIPTFLDPIAVSHERVKWGQSGDILAYDANTRTAICSEPLTWDGTKTHYITFARADGSVIPAIRVYKGTSDNVVVLTSTPSITPYTGTAKEKTKYTFGPGTGSELYALGRVLQVRQRNENTLEVYAVIDDARVHTADGGTVPALPASILTLSDKSLPLPEVKDLRAVVTGDIDQATVALSWSPAVGAENYYVEVSYDVGASWTRIADTTSTEKTFITNPKKRVLVRVAAVTLFIGPWAYWDSQEEGTIVSPAIIPKVSGLELFEQGHDTVFVGKHIKLAWRHGAAVSSFEFGSEVAGADSGGLDLQFRDYEIQVFYEGTWLRTDHRTDNQYTYTYEMNAEDYARVNNGARGAYRKLTFEVYQRGRGTQKSAVPAKLTVNNPPPGIPQGISVAAAFKTIFVSYTPPEDLDGQGVRVFIGTEQSFVKDATTLVYEGPDTTITIDKADAAGTPLATNTTYYVALQAYDAFDYSGSPSVELAVTTQQVESDEIKELVLDKVLSGSFAGKYFEVGSDGSIRSGQTAFNTGVGFWFGKVGAFVKASMGDPAGLGWTFDQGTGEFNFTGNVNVKGGSWSSAADPTKIDAGNIHASGALTLGDTGAGGNYSYMTNGGLDFFKWDTSTSQHVLYKTIRVTDRGTCSSGVRQALNGVYSQQPAIDVYPFESPTYDKTYPLQSQSIRYDARNIAFNAASGKWEFDPVCELFLTDGVAGQVINEISEREGPLKYWCYDCQDLTNDTYSAEYTLEPNTTQIAVSTTSRVERYAEEIDTGSYGWPGGAYKNYFWSNVTVYLQVRVNNGSWATVQNQSFTNVEHTDDLNVTLEYSGSFITHFRTLTRSQIGTFNYPYYYCQTYSLWQYFIENSRWNPPCRNYVSIRTNSYTSNLGATSFILAGSLKYRAEGP